MDTSHYARLIADHGSVFLEHLPTGKMRLRLSVQGVRPEEASALRTEFRAGAVTRRAARSQWVVVSAQARGVLQRIEKQVEQLSTRESAHFGARLATLRLIAPEAVDGGKGSRRARNTFDE